MVSRVSAQGCGSGRHDLYRGPRLYSGPVVLGASNLMSLDCNPQNRRSVYMALLGILVLPILSNAETYDFKVVYADGPGSREIRAGNHDTAIRILDISAGNARVQRAEAKLPRREATTPARVKKRSPASPTPAETVYAWTSRTGQMW